MRSTPACIWYKMPIVAPVVRQPIMDEKPAQMIPTSRQIRVVMKNRKTNFFWYAVLRYNALLDTTDCSKEKCVMCGVMSMVMDEVSCVTSL